MPVAIGLGVLLTAAIGLFLIRRRITWREKLLVAWILVPLAFFQLWPVKGFQYLLPIAPPIVILVGYATVRVLPATAWRRVRSRAIRRYLLPATLIAALAGTLALSSWLRIQVTVSDQFLAGSGGVPGGREAGLWIRDHVPEGATLMTIGPSMANILQYYGHRAAFGASVSPNPLHRNPSYDPITNPDREIRSGRLQYMVWDSFSAARSTFFSDRVLEYADRYHGRVVHTEFVSVTTEMGERVLAPVIVVYEVRP